MLPVWCVSKSLSSLSRYQQAWIRIALIILGNWAGDPYQIQSCSEVLKFWTSTRKDRGTRSNLGDGRPQLHKVPIARHCPLLARPPGRTTPNPPSCPTHHAPSFLLSGFDSYDSPPHLTGFTRSVRDYPKLSASELMGQSCSEH